MYFSWIDSRDKILPSLAPKSGSSYTFQNLDMKLLFVLCCIVVGTFFLVEGKHGRGGRGPRGRGRGRGRKGDRNFSTITCTETDTLPPCAHPPSRRPIPQEEVDDNLGVWVCRNQTNHRTDTFRLVTTCIDPTRAKENDECGFCEGDDPITCECDCVTARGEQGVYVQKNNRDGSVRRTTCMPEPVANARVNYDEKFACVPSDACPMA